MAFVAGLLQTAQEAGFVSMSTSIGLNKAGIQVREVRHDHKHVGLDRLGGPLLAARAINHQQGVAQGLAQRSGQHRDVPYLNREYSQVLVTGWLCPARTIGWILATRVRRSLTRMAS